MPQKILIFDIETHSAEILWDTAPEEFFRLGGYAWGTGPVRLTDDLEEMRRVIREADVVIGHNIHAFDLTAIFGKDSIEPLEMALAEKIFDTWTHATLTMPAPRLYTDRNGTKRLSASPEQAKGWYSLDNLAYQLGTAGKSHDLKALAKEFGGFGEIPITDPRFRDYLVADVEASRAVAVKLLGIAPCTGYYLREQLNAAIDAQNSRNGWRVDVDRARARVQDLDDQRDRYMRMLSERFGLPTEGKAPLRTKAGKAAVLAALRSVGVTESDLPRTAKGQPSLGGSGLVEAAEGRGEAAEELAGAIAAIGGMRPLAQLALDCVQSDGKVHPQITTLQRTGRKSTTRPGLTVWSARKEISHEKAYFIPNADDEVLVELDYSQADARIVAAYSGDTEFAKQFAPGSDAHLITARLIWGDDVVNADPMKYRGPAKPVTHAGSYNAGAKTLARASGRPEDEMKKYLENMARKYPKWTAWKQRTVDEGSRGYVVTDWGRKILIDEDREWTQSPAAYGQNGTREIVVDSLIRMARRDISIIRMLVGQIHDALVFSIPKSRVQEVVPVIRDCMEVTWKPSDGSGMSVHFPVGVGSPAINWQEAGH